MNTTAINIPELNNYWKVIRNWNDTMKIALISKISASMVKPKKRVSQKTLGDFFGVLKNEDFPSAKQIREVMKEDPQDIKDFVL